MVAFAVYASWFLLVWYHALLPWWVLLPAGAYVIAWHLSLQHEAIHAFRGVPAWLRYAIVFPPLSLWLPYPLYRASHSIHHHDGDLTVPGVDPESYYVDRTTWRAMSGVERSLLTFNQTLAGRLLVGPALRLWRMIDRETRRIRRRDYAHRRIWAVHAAAVAVLLVFICGVCGLSLWEYGLLFVYPGLSLTLLRTFTEHRATDEPGHRTGVVESNFVFGLLYLNNNLHVAHHLKPAMPWYDIPRYYRSNRVDLLRGNGRFVYRGYFELARRFWRRPVFGPVHPTL
jgi:fatty acid desaturase